MVILRMHSYVFQGRYAGGELELRPQTIGTWTLPKQYHTCMVGYHTLFNPAQPQMY